MYSYSNSRVCPVLCALAILIHFVLPGDLKAEKLAGVPGSSSQWGSGWLDLAPPVDFAKGERLKLLIGGSAKKIMVRLLPKGTPPDTTTGLISETINVSNSRIVEIMLSEDRKQVVQISVHGGPSPWGKFSLGGGNGPATIESVDRVKP